MNNASRELYIGLMSGTSMDGIDSAIVELEQNSTKLIATYSHPIPELLQQAIKALFLPGDDNIDALGSADQQLGICFAQATTTLLKRAGLKASDITAIGSHGQTVRHRPPSSNTPHPFTLQIGDPNLITARTGITTVADFRRRDMALGGQAAPLVPAFHHAVFHSKTRNRAIVNIGGISNITFLPVDGEVIGFDTGPSTKTKISMTAANGQVNTQVTHSYLNNSKPTLFYNAPHQRARGEKSSIDSGLIKN